MCIRDRTYNNCVKKEEVEQLDELSKETLDSYITKAYKDINRSDKKSYGKGNKQDRYTRVLKAVQKRDRKELRTGLGEGMYSANPAQQAAIAIAKKKKKEDDMVAKKKKQKMYAGYEPQGEVIDEKNRGDQETRKKAKGYDSFTEKRPISKAEQGTREVMGRRNTTSAMNRSGMGMAKPERETKERGERHKADRGKKTKKVRVVVQKMLAITKSSQDTLYGQVHTHQVHWLSVVK